MTTRIPLDNGVRGVEDGEIDDELIQDTTSFMKACDEGNVNMVNMLLWKYYMSERKRGLLTHGLGELSEVRLFSLSLSLSLFSLGSRRSTFLSSPYQHVEST